MAQRKNDPDSGSEKAKVRVFYAEVEGSNDSVREALKTMVAAMGRPVQVLAPPRGPGNGNAQTALAQPESTAEFEEVQDENDDGAGVADAGVSPTRKSRGTGPKKDRNQGIELVPDLEFRPEGKQPLREFFAEKDPKKDMEQTLVLTYYMQHEMALPAIGPGHIRTAFKEVGKPVPADIKATIRNMKNQKAWLNFTDLESIRVTTQGENFVEHDLPA